MTDTATPPAAAVEQPRTTHELKTWKDFFQAIVDGRKNFEVRYNDRGFQAGDHVRLVDFH